ncbi:MAG: hypothetical protein GVY18_12120 [Bacteroidetes bacterium]|jgi:hypothetical protein|nr:hypothetical protein [Bacteroidota bacterium]
MSMKQTVIQSVAFTAAVAAGSGTAAGIVNAAAGSTRGAPGITKGLSTLGQYVGGGMVHGLAVVGGSAALASLTVYRALTLLDR